MDTGFNGASGYTTSGALDRTKLAPSAVAEIGLDALFAGRSGVIADRLNKIMALSSRVIPRQAAAKATMPRAAA